MLAVRQPFPGTLINKVMQYGKPQPMCAQAARGAGHRKRHPGGEPAAREGRADPAGVPPAGILSGCQPWMVKSAVRLAGVPICTW
jgi:hypothetical protein